MTKPSIAAVLTGALMLSAPLAFAQSMPQPIRSSTATPAALSVQADQMRASKLIGSSVYDSQNQDVGSIKDIVLDQNGRVAAIVLDVGSFIGMGGKYVAVSMSDLKTSGTKLMLDQTQAQLKAAPAYELEPRGRTPNQPGH